MNSFNFKSSQLLSVIYNNKPELIRCIEVLSVKDDHIMVVENSQIKRFNKNRIMKVINMNHLTQGKLSYEPWIERFKNLRV